VTSGEAVATAESGAVTSGTGAGTGGSTGGGGGTPPRGPGAPPTVSAPTGTSRFESLREYLDTTRAGTQTRSSRVDPRIKPGGIDQANSDFDRLVNPSTVINRGNGLRTGRTTDGNYEINVRRNATSDPRPTLEIQRAQYDRIKVRYGD
jgi:hypothetical protein